MKSFLITATVVAYTVSAAPYLLSGPGIAPSDWASKQCTDQYLNDAAAQPSLRWGAADASNAWTYVKLGWNQEALRSGDVSLSLSGYMSNFFHSKDRVSCENMADNPCDDTVLCSSVNHPAGFLITNAFVAIHSIHKAAYDALTSALPLMQSHAGTFQATFAPSVKDDSAVIKEILDVFTAIIGIGSGYIWNVVAKEARWFTDDNFRGFAKDAVNAIIALGINSGKDNLPKAESIQGQLADVLGTYFESWERAQINTLQKTFQGDAASLSALDGLMNNGMILATNTPDLGSLVGEVQHIMYAKMVPAAWNLSPDNLNPVILKTSNPCATGAIGEINGFMSDSTADDTNICYDGFTFYVVSAVEVHGVAFDGAMFGTLPGGTHSNMANPIWGGLSLADFVVSSWDGYKKNGYKNGYQVASDGSDSGTDIIFENGVLTPGFASLPVCELTEAMENLSKYDNNHRYPGFPCNQY